MATLTVTNLDDSGAGSLRDVLATANATPGADRIEFDPALEGGTLVLTTGALLIADDVTIDADATGIPAPRITIDAQGRDFEVFRIDDGDADRDARVELLNLTVTGAGYSSNGINNREDLFLQFSNVIGNGNAGAIDLTSGVSGGDVELRNVIVEDNGSGILGDEVSVFESNIKGAARDSYGIVGGSVIVQSSTVQVSGRFFRGVTATELLIQDSSIGGGASSTNAVVIDSAIGGGSRYRPAAVIGEGVTVSGSALSGGQSGFGAPTVIDANEVTLVDSRVNGGAGGPAISASRVSLDSVEGSGNYGTYFIIAETLEISNSLIRNNYGSSTLRAESLSVTNTTLRGNNSGAGDIHVPAGGTAWSGTA